MIGWTRCTQAQYDALESRSADEFYYITDSRVVYLNNVCYGNRVSVVSSFPDAGAAGMVYIHDTTLEKRIWVSSAWQVIDAPKSTNISSASTDSQLPTAKAVYDYVTNAIASAGSGAGGRLLPAVQNILALKQVSGKADKDLILVEDAGSLYRYDAQSSDAADDDKVVIPDSSSGSSLVSVTWTYGDMDPVTFYPTGTITDAPLPGLTEGHTIWTGQSSEDTPGQYTLYVQSWNDGYRWRIVETADPGMAFDNASATDLESVHENPANAEWQNGTMTSETLPATSSGRWIKMTTAVTLSGGQGITISGTTVSVKIDSTFFEFGSSGDLTLKSTVLSGKMNTVSGAVENNLASFSTGGQLKDSGFRAGSSVLSSSSSDSLLATESAVQSALSFKTLS